MKIHGRGAGDHPTGSEEPHRGQDKEEVMQRGDGYVIGHRDELERTGNWTLVRRSLDCQSFGVNLVDIPQGASIPEHDETERDQEEVFFVVSGSPSLVIDGQEHPAGPGTFARLAPSHRRTVRNNGPEPCSVLIVSAPTTSGYTPMEWA
jgi:mannose-6-phosphate isomerase-like protein (cupin superfamily)